MKVSNAFFRDDRIQNARAAKNNNCLFDSVSPQVELCLQVVELQTRTANVIVIEKINITIGPPVSRAFENATYSA